MNQKFFVTSRLFVIFVVANFVASTGYCQDAKNANEDAKKDDSKKIATIEVKLEPISIYETFEGIFESTNYAEVKADFENWTDLKIAELVEEGTNVSKGQKLVAFDTESIDKAIKEAEFGLKTSEFALKAAELEMKELDATYKT